MGLVFSVEWIEDEQQNLFSGVCCHRTSLYTVNTIYEGDLFCLNMSTMDVQLVHWKGQKIFSSEKATAHKLGQLTKVVLERVSVRSLASQQKLG